MSKIKPVKMAALKLYSLNKEDQAWVLGSLPETVSSEIMTELESLKLLNLENVDSVIAELEKGNDFDEIDPVAQAIETEMASLSDVDVLLLVKSLSNIYRSRIETKCIETNRRGLAKKVSLIGDTSFNKKMSDFIIADLLTNERGEK